MGELQMDRGVQVARHHVASAAPWSRLSRLVPSLGRMTRLADEQDGLDPRELGQGTRATVGHILTNPDVHRTARGSSPVRW
jgi:hypothetical protein